jgi:hypothetical protein
MWDYTALAAITTLITHAITTAARTQLRHTAWTQPPTPRHNTNPVLTPTASVLPEHQPPFS